MGIQYVTYRQENGEDFSNVFAIFIAMINFILNNILFLGIKFRETKQIVVTFVATALKALLSVSKANRRLSGHKLYTGNIYQLLSNFLTHISPYQHIKKVRNRSYAPEKAQAPIAAKQTFDK